MAWAAIGGAVATTVVGSVMKKKGGGGGSGSGSGGSGGSPAPANPMIAESARINLDAAKVGFTNAADLMERYKSMYQPTEDRFISDANNIDSVENINQAAGAATAGVQSQYDGALGQASRRLASMGVNPNSGASLALQQDAALGVGAAKAFAANKAVADAKTKGMAARIAVTGVGNGVAQLANQASQIAHAGTNSAGAVLNSQYSTDTGYATSNNALNAKADEGIGKMVGTIGSNLVKYGLDRWGKKSDTKI